MTRPYRPSSGTEGAYFMAAFCDQCVHDAAFRDGTGDSCPIAANTICYDLDDAEYPNEWAYRDGEPVCTAVTRDPAKLSAAPGDGGS